MPEAPRSCPRCGSPLASGPECPGCGVVLAKARPRSAPPADPPAPDPRRADRGWWHFPVAMVALMAGGLYLWESGRESAPPAATAGRPRSPVVPARPTPGEPGQSPTATDPADEAAPGEGAPADPVAEATLHLHRFATTTQDPETLEMRRRVKEEDWYGAETAARALLEKRPRDDQAWCALAISLVHEDKLRDAGDAARHCRDRGLQDSIEARLATGAHSVEHQVAHFHVRYDADVHEEIARDVLRILESGYATLVSALGFEPRRPIPVDLLSREAYVEETGKNWTAGEYSHGDGRIRVKVRNLTVTPEFENTVLHELVHAFLADLTRRRTPRELNEGLAQYLTGRRIGWEVTSPVDAARYPWKPFYDDALSFTEYLVGQRGVSGVVEALTALGEGGDPNAPFRRVFGDDLQELHRKWAARRGQMAGSP
jgi:hypothetical protein